MSIRQGFIVIAVAVIALLAAIFYVMTLVVQNQREVATAEARQYVS